MSDEPADDETGPPAGPRRRFLAAAVALAALPAAWALLDLLLRRDLPGAGALQHLAFRALVVPMEWLTDAPGNRLTLVGIVWGFALAGALGNRRGRFARLVFGATAAGVVAFEAVTCVLALLMERGLALGVVVAVAAWLGLSWRVRQRSGAALSPSPAAPAAGFLVVGATAAAASLYYVYALFMTSGSGYPLLQALGRAMRERGVSFFVPYLVVVVVLGGAAAWLARRRLSPSVALPGVVAGVLLGAMSAPGGALVVVPAGFAIVAALLPTLRGVSGPARWPARAALPTVIAGLLLGHTYSARVLDCPAPGEIPELRLLARTGEAFRVVEGDGFLGLSLREERRLARFDFGDGSGSGSSEDGDGDGDGDGLRTVAAGSLQQPGWRGPDAPLHGSPEELVYAPEAGSWFASVTPSDPADWLGPLDRESSLRNVIAQTDGGLRTVTRVIALPDLCWINTMHWGQADQLLYLGCEERAGLHRYGVQTGLRDAQTDPVLGDVQDIAFGEGRLDDRFFTISLWRSPRLTELERDTLRIRRQVRIGGTHYHLAYDAVGEQLFASAYYGARVHVVDAATLRLAGSVPAGFGTREVAVHSRRRLLLASGTYDGLLRVWQLGGDAAGADASSPLPKPLRQIKVGGHIKDIAIDEESDRAWFWSQCGLYELDLAAVVGS